MSITAETIMELAKCLDRLKKYAASYDSLAEGEFLSVNLTHSAAKRATLDASVALSRWRRTRTNWNRPK